MARLLEDCEFHLALLPELRSAGTYNGSWVDCAGAINLAAGILLGNTTGKVDVKLQESNNASTASDIPGAAIAGKSGTDDNTPATIDVNMSLRANRKRYVRPVLTIEAAAVACVGVGFFIHKGGQPVTNTPATVFA
jgi:hypothetical protein